MNDAREQLREAALSCLGRDAPAGELVDCVSSHFPELEAYREDEDLILKRAGRFLILRRIGADRFRVSENIAVPSTNLVDHGGGAERTLDEAIAEIAALASK